MLKALVLMFLLIGGISHAEPINQFCGKVVAVKNDTSRYVFSILDDKTKKVVEISVFAEEAPIVASNVSIAIQKDKPICTDGLSGWVSTEVKLD